MSEEKKPTAPKTETQATATPGPVVTATAAAAAPAKALASRVVEKGNLGHAIAPAPAPAKPAGLYEVIYGSILLGYEGDGEVRVGAGGKVHLTAEEAGPLVASKSVRFLESAAA